MNLNLRTLVTVRARYRCEYCQLHSDDSPLFEFQVEHIIPRQHGGLSTQDNLCYACPECNWAKGPNIAGLLNSSIYPLYHPRKQQWNRHFRWHHTILIGKTKIGKVTIQLLNINGHSRIMLREHLLFEGRFPGD